MRRWLAMGTAFAVLWLFVRGVALQPVVIAEEFLIGLAVGLPIAFVFRRFYRQEFALAQLRGCPYAVVYVAFFLKELLTANVEVAYRVLAPSMPIEPDVVEVPLRVETDIAITTIANSITLTPGTLTMDYDAASNTLYVHGITGRNREAVVEPIRRWEDYAIRIFDEDARPDDPAPTPAERKAAMFEDDGDGSTDPESDERIEGQGGDGDGE